MDKFAIKYTILKESSMPVTLCLLHKINLVGCNRKPMPLTIDMEQIRIVYKRNVYNRNVYTRLNSKSTKTLHLIQTIVRMSIVYMPFSVPIFSQIGSVVWEQSIFFVFFYKLIFAVSNWFRDLILHFWKVHC